MGKINIPQNSWNKDYTGIVLDYNPYVIQFESVICVLTNVETSRKITIDFCEPLSFLQSSHINIIEETTIFMIQTDFGFLGHYKGWELLYENEKINYRPHAFIKNLTHNGYFGYIDILEEGFIWRHKKDSRIFMPKANNICDAIDEFNTIFSTMKNHFSEPK